VAEIQVGRRQLRCRSGHEFTAENTGYKTIGQRQQRFCLKCEAARLASKPKIIPGVTCEMYARKKELAEIVAATGSRVAAEEWREIKSRIEAARREWAAMGGAA